jgi:hypothetical protein
MHKSREKGAKGKDEGRDEGGKENKMKENGKLIPILSFYSSFNADRKREREEIGRTETRRIGNEEPREIGTRNKVGHIV